ncbi:MAG: 50S ribosomal protein L21 [Candidatus Neomarinimicrobiota bacterium]
MYAIVDYAGRQVRVEQGQEVKFPLLDGEPGANVTIERVLLLADNGEARIGQPVVAGASVDATILSHGRERKIIVFKFKRRKGYRKKAGHRQDYTTLRINAINAAKPAAKSKAPATKAAPKKAAAKPKAAPKPAAAKKPAAKGTKVAAKPKTTSSTGSKGAQSAGQKTGDAGKKG